MAAPKKPQDHKPKAEDVPKAFTFTVDGETYTLKDTKEMTEKVSFFRRIRDQDPFGQLCSMVEELAKDEATLDAFDVVLDSGKERVKQFDEEFTEHVKAVTGGANTGESKAS